MLTIWKYQLPITPGVHEIEAPAANTPLAVQIQDGLPCLWAIVDDDEDKIPYKIVIAETGKPLPPDTGHYIGTYQLPSGQTVHHLFEYMGRGA